MTQPALRKKAGAGEPILTLANKITVLRILLVPIIVIGMIQGQTVWVYGLLGFCMLTDLLDGLVARRRAEKTQLGAFLDPMADKLLLTAVYITLTFMGRIDTWVFVVIFSRDLLIVLGWSVIFILTSSSTVKPRPLGKITTAVQMITALACMIGVDGIARAILIWSTIAVTVVSAIDYIRSGEKRLGEWG